MMLTRADPRACDVSKDTQETSGSSRVVDEAASFCVTVTHPAVVPVLSELSLTVSVPLCLSELFHTMCCKTYKQIPDAR